MSPSVMMSVSSCRLLAMVTLIGSLAIMVGPTYNLTRATTAAASPEGAPPCELAAQRQVRPSAGPECSIFDVTLTMDAVCPSSALDVVLVVDRSGSMDGVWKSAKDIALGLVGRLAAEASSTVRFGLVDATVVDGMFPQIIRGITDDARLISRDIARLGNDTNRDDEVPAALDAATRMLRLAQTNVDDVPRSVILLLSDGGQQQARDFRLAVVRAQAAGVGFSGVCFRTSLNMCDTVSDSVADPHDYLELTPGAIDAALVADTVTRRLLERQLTAVRVHDEVVDALEILPGSVAPAATVAGNAITWSFPPGLAETMTMTYRLQPRVATFDGVAASGSLVYTDSLGVAAVQPVPPANLRVTGPCITPSPPAEPSATTAPTASPTASPTARPTATPAPTPLPRPLFLPLLLTEACASVHQRVDVVLVLDTSGSMAGPKLVDAQAAALAFVDLMDLAPGRDQVAVVRFDTTAEVAQGLTGDRVAVEAAIRGLAAREGTYMDRGLAAALGELTGPRRNEANTAVAVLLTDGQQTGGPAAALAAADQVRAAGVRLYTIGLGADVDGATLAAMAGGGGRYRYAPDSGALAAIYAEVARDIQCPAEGLWPWSPAP